MDDPIKNMIAKTAKVIAMIFLTLRFLTFQNNILIGIINIDSRLCGNDTLFI
jgi:hypothetical protein